MATGTLVVRGWKPKISRLVQVFAGLALLSTACGCIVVPAYAPPPPRYHYYNYGY